MSKHRKAVKQNRAVAVVMAFMVGLTTGTSGVVPTSSFPGEFNQAAVVENSRVKVNSAGFECKSEGWTQATVLKVEGNYVAVHPEDLVNYTVEEQRCVLEDWITPNNTILIDNEHRVHSISNEWIEKVRDHA